MKIYDRNQTIFSVDQLHYRKYSVDNLQTNKYPVQGSYIIIQPLHLEYVETDTLQKVMEILTLIHIWGTILTYST